MLIKIICAFQFSWLGFVMFSGFLLVSLRHYEVILYYVLLFAWRRWIYFLCKVSDSDCPALEGECAKHSTPHTG